MSPPLKNAKTFLESTPTSLNNNGRGQRFLPSRRLENRTEHRIDGNNEALPPRSSLTATNASKNLAPNVTLTAFNSAFKKSGPVRRTTLQMMMHEIIRDLLVKCVQSPIARAPHVFDDDPRHLRALAELSLEGARLFDRFFSEIALQGGLRQQIRGKITSDFAELVTTAVEGETCGELYFSLLQRAEDFETVPSEEYDDIYSEKREWLQQDFARELGIDLP